MPAPGSQQFTLFQTGKEATSGTLVAATRQWYPDGTGIINIDPMLAFHGGNRGTRTRTAYASQKGIAVNLSYRSHPDVGVAWDELPIILNQADGGTVGSGASANKTWTWAPAQAAAPTNAVSHSIEVGDDVQAYKFEYGMARSFTLSAARDGMTQLSVDWFARQPTKGAMAAVAPNSAVRIPGALWMPIFATSQANLNSGGTATNFLLDWQVQVTTGLEPRYYQDGTMYFGQAVASQPLNADITLHVESTALAISEFYDKWMARTVDFLRLKAIGPVLGSGNYSASLDFALLYNSVKPIASEVDGVNVYEITAQSVYDTAWTQSMGGTVVCSGTAIP